MWVAVKGLLSFLGSPAGRLLLIALAFFAWGAYQRVDATADCKEDQVRQQLAEAQRQNAIAARIAAEARQRADAAEAEITRLERIADEIANDTDASCPISPADLERLQRIR